MPQRRLEGCHDWHTIEDRFVHRRDLRGHNTRATQLQTNAEAPAGRRDVQQGPRLSRCQPLALRSNVSSAPVRASSGDRRASRFRCQSVKSSRPTAVAADHARLCERPTWLLAAQPFHQRMQGCLRFGRGPVVQEILDRHRLEWSRWQRVAHGSPRFSACPMSGRGLTGGRPPCVDPVRRLHARARTGPVGRQRLDRSGGSRRSRVGPHDGGQVACAAEVREPRRRHMARARTPDMVSFSFAARAPANCPRHA